MRSKWLLVSFLISLILVVTVILAFPPRPAQAQAVGYVTSGQQSVLATTAVVTGTSYGSICIKALQGNAINVYLGGPAVTISTGMELAPGNSYCAPSNQSEFYVVASTTGASVSWVTSR
jgi:hypothetical protein